MAAPVAVAVQAAAGGPAGAAAPRPSPTRFLSQFTRLSKVLSGVLVAGYVIGLVLPIVREYTALIPAKTVPCAWNLITSSYIELSLLGTLLDIVAVLGCARLVEPVWGSKEFLRFVAVVNAGAAGALFLAAMAAYVLTQNERIIYGQYGGCGAASAGFLVAIKQMTPEAEVNLVAFRLRAKHAPGVALLAVTAVQVGLGSIRELPLLWLGAYIAWLYLRFLQPKADTGLRGDPSDAFAFDTFFPEALRPMASRVSSGCGRVFFCCSMMSKSGVVLPAEGGTAVSGAMGVTKPLPGNDAAEAQRRRERGARALEERMGEVAEGTIPADGAAGETKV